MNARVVPQRYQVLPAAKLHPHPDNPNRGDVAAIGESIDATGFWGAVLVQQSSMTILAGEHRWRAAQAEGRLAKVPCIVIDVDDEAARRILLADNAYAALGVMDEDQLAALLGGLATSADALAGTGYSLDALDELRERLGAGPLTDDAQDSDADYADSPEDRPYEEQGTYAERGLAVIQVVVPQGDAPEFRSLVEAGRVRLGDGEAATGVVVLAALRGWLG